MNKTIDHSERNGIPGWTLWMACAVLSGAAAWGVHQVVIPHVLSKLPEYRITPTLTQTLYLRFWTAAFLSILFVILAVISIRQPSNQIPLRQKGIAILFLAVLLRLVSPDIAFNSIVRPDGVHFSVTAQQLIKHGTLMIPTGTSMLPPRTLPGVSFLQACTQWINPEHPGYGIFAIWFCAVFSVWLAFFFAKRLWGSSAAWIAASLIALSPALAWYSRQLMSEIPWGLSVMMAAGMFATGLKKPGQVLLAGLIAGLGMLFKSSHLVIMLGMLGGMIMFQFRNRSIPGKIWGIFLGGMILGSFPAFLYNRLLLGDWLSTAYHIYWPGWASATTALNIKYLWAPPLINGAMGNIPYYTLALLGLDPRPERMIILPGLVVLLGCLVFLGRKKKSENRPSDLFISISAGAVIFYGIACMLYSFQEPRFLLPIFPVLFVAVSGAAARGLTTTILRSSKLQHAVSTGILIVLVGLGMAIITVDYVEGRLPERVRFEQLAEATQGYDIVVSDEDPVLLTIFNIWTSDTRVWPMLLPGELWFPKDPGKLYKEEHKAVEPFEGTVPVIHAALQDGKTVAAYITKPHYRPEAWQAFTNAFVLTPTPHKSIHKLMQVSLRQKKQPRKSPAEAALSGQQASLSSLSSTTSEDNFMLGMEMPDYATAKERSLPVHPVTLSPFALSQTEVDQRSFVSFLNDEDARNAIVLQTNTFKTDVYWTAGNSTSLWPICTLDNAEDNNAIRTSTNSRSLFFIPEEKKFMDRHPATMVSWYGAVLYCNWLNRKAGLPQTYTFTTNGAVMRDNHTSGYRLPTEAEWEFTASWNGRSKTVYTWGNEWDPAAANLAASPRPARHSNEPFTVPSDQPAPWTQQDNSSSQRHQHMTGNVWEWCDNWYYDYTSAAQTNPCGPSTGSVKVVRGGSFRTHQPAAWSAFRGIASPETMTDDIGFRTAQSK